MDKHHRSGSIDYNIKTKKDEVLKYSRYTTLRKSSNSLIGAIHRERLKKSYSSELNEDE